jgi:hypothetical protein
MHLVQDKVQWRAHVNTVMNTGFHKRREMSCTAERLLASREGLFHEVTDRGCADANWTELTQDTVQHRTLVILVSNPRFLLTQN